MNASPSFVSDSAAAMGAGGGGLYGTRPWEAIAAIARRRGRRCDAGGSRDGRKLALVIEGGAMRGVCSAGGALALARLGLTEAFDEVYATSAGAMNASYFLSGQGEMGITIYYEDLATGATGATGAIHATRRFFNPLRFWKMLDLDYLFEHVVARAKPLDIQRLKRSPSRLFVAVMDQRTGRGRLIDITRSEAPVLTVLKAATAMPLVYNGRVEVESIQCMDGGLAIPFPLQQAVENGCTDILALLTRPAGFRHPPWTALQRRLFDLLCARGNPELNRAFLQGPMRNHEARALALGLTPVPAGINIATILPGPTPQVGRFTTHSATLRAAAADYAQRVWALFGEIAL